MILLFVSAAWVALLAAMLARAITQYRHYRIIGPDADPPTAPASDVTVIVPARNEARNIERCVNAILAQQYPRDHLRILVVDDHSHDQTAPIVERLAQSDPRIRLIESEPLPPSWLGKPHACAQAARDANGAWLCFVDADTIAEPMLIATAIQTATREELDLLSLQPFQELVSAWERLILPCGFFLVAFTQDLRRTNDPSSPRASVNGQFLLARRSAYNRAGGHAAVRDQIAEDSALAAKMKSAGFKIMVLGTRDLLHTRMYTDFRSLWEGVARQAASLLGGNVALLMASVASFLLAVLAVGLPIATASLLAVDRSAAHVAALLLAMAGSLSLLGTHVGAARYFRIPIWYGLLSPLGYVMAAAIGVYAIWGRSRGQIRWKGRIYQVTPEDAVGASGARALR